MTFTVEWENLPLAEGTLALPEELGALENRAVVHRSAFSKLLRELFAVYQESI